MKKLRLGCVVMAAGDSKRFRGNKLLALYDGRTLIERALGAVPEKEFHKVAVVSQYQEILEMAKRYGFIPVLNSAPEEGVSLTVRLVKFLIRHSPKGPLYQRAAIVQRQQLIASESL